MASLSLLLSHSRRISNHTSWGCMRRLHFKDVKMPFSTSAGELGNAGQESGPGPRKAKDQIESSEPGLDVELSGMPKLKPATDLAIPETRLTVLPNGVRVASEENYGQVSNVGVFVDAENDLNNQGVSYFLEKMAFKTSKSMSNDDIHKSLDRMGGTVLTNTNREQIVYQVDVMRGELEGALELLSETVCNPAYTEEDIEETREVIKFEREDMEYEPMGLLQEWIHEAAYGENTLLGQPLLTQLDKLDGFSSKILEEYRKKVMVGSKIVVAGGGVDHDELVALAEKKFGHIPSSESSESSEASTSSKQSSRHPVYKGGEVRVKAEVKQAHVSETFVDAPPAMTHLQIAFGVDGWHSKDLVPLCVLHTLLGGGSSFSAGGPGKGMYTRLYTEVLNSNYWIDSVIATTVMYANTGLIGIYGTALPKDAFQLTNAICQQLYKIAIVPVRDDELSRARNQLKSSVCMNLESRSILCEDIGRQTLTYDQREQYEVTCEKINAVTADDLLRVAQKMVQNKPAVVAYGDITNIPTYDEISQVFAGFRDGSVFEEIRKSKEGK